MRAIPRQNRQRRAMSYSESKCEGKIPACNRDNKMKMKTLTFLILSFTSVALADDFKTVDGKEYKNATVSRVEPDGIALATSSGISKVYFTELPKEVQERFHYDAEKATAYSAEQNANLELLRKQQEEAQRQAAGATEKKNKYLGEQESAREATKNKQDKIRALEARYQELDQQEDDLLLRIGEGEVGQYRAIPNAGLHAQLPFLHSHLDDVRREKDQVRRQLEDAQRQQK